MDLERSNQGFLQQLIENSHVVNKWIIVSFSLQNKVKMDGQ